MSHHNPFLTFGIVALYYLGVFLPLPSGAFLFQNPPLRSINENEADLQQFFDASSQQRKKQLPLYMEGKSDVTAESSLNIVLFGVGDLRTDDHGGLNRAILQASRKDDSHILPLLIIDDDTLGNIPGAVSHTVDTAYMLVAAVTDLQKGLKEKLGLDLRILTTSDTLPTALVKEIQKHTAENDDTANIGVHVCDLGDVDNQLGYGPYSAIQNSNLPENIQVIPWTNHLREKPWKEVESLPDKYPKFAAKFSLEPPTLPISIDSIQDALPSIKQAKVALHHTKIPTAEELSDRIQSNLGLDPASVRAEVNTGIYQSHWGGLKASTIGETEVLKHVSTYIEEFQEDDALWVQHPDYIARDCPRNKRSLEHATFGWFLKGAGTKPYPETNNLLAGEPMTRYLSAPLLFGTISPRRLWHATTRQHSFFVSPLKTLVEGREWHNLLAARNLRTKPQFQKAEKSPGETHYGYWRWHGYLCRYAQTPISSTTMQSTDGDREGVLFIHGFGASGTQWAKTMKKLSDIMQNEADQPRVLEGLAPDLLGFGECEKPAISYSIYVWDAQVTDFIKEVAVARQKWDTFVIGGNSIGGFCAASTAANECATVACGSVCSSGAPGTGKCRGAVLMNPAGPIQSREEVQKIEAQSGRDRSKLLTVAQVSAGGLLPPCKPLARPVARFFGNGLLAYLRPRIQSVCSNLYPTNPVAVDTALCGTIERDSLDPGAINVMISGAKLPPPRTMNEMLKADFGAMTPETLDNSIPEVSFDGPVLIATGVLDPLNDATARSEGLKGLRAGIEFDPINGGHCPHDELPEDVAKSISRWMSTSLRATNTATSKAMTQPTSPSSILSQ